MPAKFLALCAMSLISASTAWAQAGRTLPLSFEAAGSGFRALAQGYTVDVDSTGAAVRLPNGRVLGIRLEGSSKRPAGPGSGDSAGVANYLIGNDPSQWRRNVPQFSRVKYSSVYPGIDLVYYGQGRQLEFDIVVAPGTDPNTVRFRFEGSDRTGSKGTGGLLLDAGGQQVELQAPVVYQTVGGSRRTIRAGFIRDGANRARLRLATYDRNLPLVIDPAVAVTTTYIGGSGSDVASAITTDSLGNVYVAGTTASRDFPLTSSPIPPSASPVGAAFIVKLSPGGAPVYSTYINGSSGASGAYGLAVNSAGDAYLAGATNSNSFPVTGGAFQSVPRGIENAFALELNQAGTALIFATLCGGSGNDQVGALAIDAAGDAFIAGYTTSTNYPTTKGAFQTTYGGGFSDGFVTQFSPSGGAVFSTYLGTAGADQINGITLDGNGSPYVTGQTDSQAFPVSTGAFQPANKATQLGGVTGFVTHLSADGSTLLASTYAGGTVYDFGQSIVFGLDGNIYVAGGTASTDFPITAGAFQPRNSGFQAAFITVFDPTLAQVLASTYLGGSGQGYDVGYGLAVGPDGTVYVGGQIGPLSIPGFAAPDLPASDDVAFFGAFTKNLTSAVIPVTAVSALQGYVDGIALDANNKAWFSANGQGANNPINTPKAPLSANSEPPFIGFVPTSRDPIMVTKKLISPTGEIHDGDELIFQVTVTNQDSVERFFRVRDSVTGRFSIFMWSTAGSNFGGNCQENNSRYGTFNAGYSCGSVVPALIRAGQSIVITDHFRARYNSLGDVVQDTNTASVSSTDKGMFATDFTSEYSAWVPFSILPPDCSSSGSSRQGAASHEAPADTGSCPVSGATPQTINFPAIPFQTAGAAPAALTATATSQLPVTFVGGDGVVCSVTGSTITILATGSCFVAAEQAGNQTFAPADPVSQVFPVIAAGAPIITEGGVVPVFSTSTTIQPASWVSVFGNNLAAMPVTWNGDFPTQLGGDTVTINGKNAYLWYVSPTQINLQAPDDTTTGVVPVTVTTAAGSWTSTVTLGPISPSFLLLDQTHVTGIILRSGGKYDILGPTGTSLGFPTVAAAAGDTLELFCVGFGPTVPVVPAGQPVTASALTTNMVQLKIGGTPVMPLGAGIGSAGLYQVNVTIPPGLGTGDLTLVATVGGLQTQSGIVISLQ